MRIIINYGIVIVLLIFTLTGCAIFDLIFKHPEDWNDEGEVTEQFKRGDLTLDEFTFLLNSQKDLLELQSLTREGLAK